ncbi:MAG: putative manganese-dependent inorganic diphosphatase, partial [Defluviitaleaceae bacterium]|nr:putative manganese-dependent inorganic diphosphatase [Defluviitaleaceae bacterium]
DYFGVEHPPALHDVRLRLEDLQLYQPAPLLASQPVKAAWEQLHRVEGSRMVPITREDGSIEGIITIADVAEIFMELSNEDITKKHEIRFENLVEILGGKVFAGKYLYNVLCGRLYIGTNFVDEDIDNRDVVITAQMSSALHCAYELDCGCIILTDGVSPKGLEKADCAIVCVDASMFEAVSLISQAISIGSVMNRANIVTFAENSYLEDVVDVMRTSRHRNFPILDRAGVLSGVISRRHLMSYKGRKVILIDHNERSQSVDGLAQAEIIEIIDHHRVADIQTDSPLYVRSEPVGSTATIICKMYLENNVEIPREIAGLLLAAILSDTLMFSSPTCTNEDRKMANLLAISAKVELTEFGREMFTVSTALADMAVVDILAQDRKPFTFGAHRAYISQINTLDFGGIANRIDEFFHIMEEYYESHDCSLVMLMITDIVSEGSEIIAIGRGKKLLEQAYGLKSDERSIFLPGVVSRKKQIVPTLTQFASMNY